MLLGHRATNQHTSIVLLALPTSVQDTTELTLGSALAKAGIPETQNLPQKCASEVCVKFVKLPFHRYNFFLQNSWVILFFAMVPTQSSAHFQTKFIHTHTHTHIHTHTHSHTHTHTHTHKNQHTKPRKIFAGQIHRRAAWISSKWNYTVVFM